MKTNRLPILILVGWLLNATTPAAQVSFTYLHHFGESSLIGQFAHPFSRGPDGTLYGVTEFGGAGGATVYGILYSLSPDGSTRTILREFGSVTNGGSQPIGTVVPTAGGRIYGVTRRGGANNRGVIYGVNTNGAGFAVVHELPPPATAENYRLIEGSDGRIYGLGGAEGVIAFDANGGGFSVIHSNANTRFTSFDSLFEGQDGYLYIVASIDSVDVSDGAVYRLSRDGSSFTVLRSRIPFRGVIGGATPAPCCAFQSADGFIYGAEDEGGDSYFFRTDTNVATSVTNWVEQGTLTLLGFQHLPTTFFQASDGKFYGSFSLPYVFAPQGYLFRWDSWDNLPDTRTNLVNWPASILGPFGGFPGKSFLEGSDGRFYGVVDGGGRHGAGLVFRVNKDGAGFTHLHEFIPNDGSNASPPAILGSDGYLYGTTHDGGLQELGTIYRMRPDGTDYNMIRQFFSRDEGADPAGGVIDGQDGFLYGATASGGSQNLGTVFKLRYDGSEFAVLYNIRTNRPNVASPIDPAFVSASLILDTNGWLYGVGTTGGSAGRGGVFRAHKDGSLFTNLHNFIVGEARRPAAALVLARDGKLYGTTENGGTIDSGVLYRLNPDGGAFQILRSFGGVGDGANPIAPLWQDAAGVLHGTTFGGGTNNFGTVFRFNPTNSNYAVLHHFGDGSDGRRPSAGLIEASDGSLVGATRFGGGGGAGQQLGTIFKLNKDGTGYEVLRSFTGAGGDGESIFSRLAIGPADTFFGTTSLGGSRGLGTVFRFALGGTGIALAIAPTNTTLQSGQTRTFISGGGTPPYTFSFGQNLSGGTVNPASGLYTAGPTNTVLDSVRVTDSLAATALATIAVAPLNLTVTAATPQEFLDHLTQIEGNLVLDNSDTLTALLLPNLTSVAGDLIMQNNDQLQALDLGALQTVGGNFVIANNPGLTNVSAGALTNVVGAVDVSNNSTLDTVDVSSLALVGGAVVVSNNSTLDTVDISSLALVGGAVTVSHNSTLDTVDVSSLALVGGTVVVSNNSTLDTVDISSLAIVGGNVIISSNAPTATTDLSSLKTVGHGTNAAMVKLQQGTFVFTNGFTIPTNVTFAGFGTLAGSITNTGAFTPGSSPGQFHITGNLVLNGNSELRFELAGSGSGEADFLSVTGGITLGGVLSVTLINGAPLTLTNGASFTLITSGSPITGAFANVASGGQLTTTDGAARFTVLYAGQTSVRLTSAVLLDNDGDGASNAQELLAGTDPNNAASVFRIVTIAPEAGNLRVTWSTVGGKSYVVQTNGSLAQPFTDSGAPIVIPGTGESTTNILAPVATDTIPAGFYRIRLGP